MGSTPILDQLIANAWPAAETQLRGGWRFRWTSEVSRRANSALPVGNPEELEELVEFGEDFYGARGGAPRFQVSAASAPEGLDRYLVRRGYVADTRTFVMTVAADRLSDATSPGTWTTRTSAVVTDPWFETYLASDASQYPAADDARICREILLVPPSPTVFALLEEGGEAVAVGQVVIEDTWAGLQCIATLESHRRRGAAGAILHHLASAARDAGAKRCYLAVTAANAPALELYRRCDFRVAHEYTYYVR